VEAAPPVVERATLPAANPALPAVPHVSGALAIKVIYPDSGHLIQSRDSNFILGSVGNGDAGLTINGQLAPVWPNGSFLAWLPNPPASAPKYELVATTGTDTARLTLPVKINVPPTGPPPPPDTIVPMSPARYAALIGPAVYASDTERVITAYALTGGIKRWFLLPETVVEITGTKGASAYAKLDASQTVRIDKVDLRMLDSGTAPPKTVTASPFEMKGAAEWTDVVIPISARPAFLVEEGPSSLVLTLYGTTARTKKQISEKPPEGSYLTSVSSISDGPSMQYIMTLRGPVYGYLPLWEDGKFTLRVRSLPAVDAVSPLKGLTITVDPGHPPIGATGPTGLWEPEATLAVGLKLRDILQAKGANVVMTRTTPDPVALNLRESISRRANANAFVSIHLNAVGDGSNPFRAQGTATYHYFLHSGPMASAVQKAAVAQLGLPDNGVKRENFAVVRGTWMPSILVEGAFIIMPDQEAALRTPEYQARYAEGIAEGLEAYFRSLAPAEK
jgi:N-acetylmuramoyl-L-alanine amidase